MGRATVFTHITAIVLVGLLATGLAGEATADVNWATLTSLKDVRRMRTFHDSVFAATGGGLLVITDPGRPGRMYDNLSSLRATDLTDIIEAADGQKWVAAQGKLIKFSGEQSQVYPFFDVDGKPIRLLCLADDGDNVWVGTTIGLVLFSKINDGGQIQDSYQIFGTLNSAPAVNDILLVGDSIWLATTAGIAAADRRIPNRLKVPSTWTTWGSSNRPELGTSQPRRIVLFEANYYVGTSDGLFRLDRVPGDTLIQLPADTPPWVTELKIENDSLFFYVPGGLGVIKSGTITLLGTFGLPIFPTNGTNTGTYRWLALLGETGLYSNAAGPFQLYPYTGLPTNQVSDVVVAGDGTVTGLFGRKLAFRQNDTGWTKLIPSTNPVTVGTADPRANVWVGTFGDGLWRLTADSLFNFDETNSSMRGNNDPPPGPNYVVIKGLAADSRYIYVACYRALNGYPVAFGDLDNLNSLSGWDSLGIVDGITDQFVTGLDHYGTMVAVGTEANGVFTVDLGPDPRNKSDDTSAHFTATVGPLISDAVRCVRFSPTGDLWVGTNFGVSRLIAGYPRFTTVNLPDGFGPDVRAIEFDPRGNVWFGSTNGVARFDAVDTSITAYSSLTSGLVNDVVNNIRYDATTGNTYIATEGGISVARSEFGLPTDNVKKVLSFPNPYVIRSSSDILRFNFAKPGTVRIVTLSGVRVAEVDVNAGWDGRNDSGRPVASGVYFFIITSRDDGTIGSGKFLLVREQ